MVQQNTIKLAAKFVANKILLLFVFSNILSCTSLGPYEAKSPCVSIESDNPYYRAPCTRRPVNSLRELI
ncbi:MAG: DUF2706 domain-containing protein [Rickettsiaceae bacterium]|nr:DUF2706 domain-containing protein [Rickettsiaceae bacterium]